ncbi:hypothetical protein [Olivibacter jilunii]|uniref:hypothetical protein n=1 Tax=Olivibacter jilunii TaxID=985016 RepID=UPI003F1798FB
MKQRFTSIKIWLLLSGLTLLTLSSFAQGVIVNQDGTISIQNGSTIISSNGSVSTVHGSIIVNADGSHSVIAGSSVINANGTVSTIALPLASEKEDNHPFSDSKDSDEQYFPPRHNKKINISKSQKLKQNPSSTIPVESFSHPVSTDPFQLNNDKNLRQKNKSVVSISN